MFKGDTSNPPDLEKIHKKITNYINILFLYYNSSSFDFEKSFLKELISKNFLKGNSPDYTLEVTLEDFKELHDPTDLKNNLG